MAWQISCTPKRDLNACALTGTHLCIALHPISDVLFDAGRKHLCVLRDHPHVAVHAAQIQAAQVPPVQQDAPGRRVVEPHQEVHNGRLAPPAAPNEGAHLPWRHMQIDASQNLQRRARSGKSRRGLRCNEDEASGRGFCDIATSRQIASQR
jgi:hypothetical protein